MADLHSIGVPELGGPQEGFLRHMFGWDVIREGLCECREGREGSSIASPHMLRWHAKCELASCCFNTPRHSEGPVSPSCKDHSVVGIPKCLLS